MEIKRKFKWGNKERKGVTLCKEIGKPVRKEKKRARISKTKETEFWEKRERSQERGGRAKREPDFCRVLNHLNPGKGEAN